MIAVADSIVVCNCGERRGVVHRFGEAVVDLLGDLADRVGEQQDRYDERHHDDHDDARDDVADDPTGGRAYWLRRSDACVAAPLRSIRRSRGRA